jgi:hypothetical protein
MASMNLEGPFPLSFEHIDRCVRPSGPGVFALGYPGPADVFYVNFVGRDDGDLRARLLDFIGSDVGFKFRTLDSAQAAFHRECELFHAFRPPGNRIHPSRPRLTTWTCPRCRLLGSFD